MSPITWAFIGVIGALIATSFFLKSSFPYQEPSTTIPQAEVDSANTRVWVLHTLIYGGVFLVGILGIQFNGKKFVDDASRLNL